MFILSWSLFQYKGTPSEEGLIADAEAAFTWLQKHKHIDKKQIIIFGRSLGGMYVVVLIPSLIFVQLSERQLDISVEGFFNLSQLFFSSFLFALLVTNTNT